MTLSLTLRITVADLPLSSRCQSSFHCSIVFDKGIPDQALFVAFVDFEKAFDRVHHRKLLEILENNGIGSKCLRIIRNLYATQTAHTRQDPSTIISITRGVRQGCILSPTLYNIYSEEALKLLERIKGQKLEDKQSTE